MAERTEECDYCGKILDSDEWHEEEECIQYLALQNRILRAKLEVLEKRLDNLIFKNGLHE